ncbi:hypothetical protein ACF05W_01150 [Streptomyces lydicus]|uniref:hypothetical protein n=1 Tax=Streptomyces lydicus TaxID=47763 RepID=UPI0036F98C86
MTLVSPTRTTDPTAAEPLLSYNLSTNPDPLKASEENPSTSEKRGELIIVGSLSHRDPADVKEIKVKVPAGTLSPDLATNLSSATAWISLKDWTVQLNDSSDEFVFTPTESHETIGPDTGFTIQLSQISINRKVGTAQITVTERSRTGQSAFQDRSTTFDVGKFPADFYMRNFIANQADNIANGSEITLTWERSTNATYELLYGGTSLNVTNETTRTITNITSDTTFYLRGTNGADPTNPVVRMLTAQVTVNKPDLEVGNLTVHGKINAGSGLLSVPSVIVNGTLLVEGSSNLGRKSTLIWAPTPRPGHRSKTFLADTSGLVIGHVRVIEAGGKGRISMVSGNEGRDANWSGHADLTTLVMPVEFSKTFRLGCTQDEAGGHQSITFYWMPFGSGGVTDISAVEEGHVPTGSPEAP